MANVLQNMELKTIQWFPSRTTHTPCHITIDTTVMLSMLYEGRDKQQLLRGATSSPEIRAIWFSLFSFKNRRGDKVFANSIATDGHSISVHYTKSEVQSQKDSQSINRKILRIAHYDKTKNMTAEQKDAYRAEKAISQQATKRQRLSTDHEARVAYAQNAAPAPERLRRKVDGIPYAADMTATERAETDGRPYVGIDPGRRDYLNMISDPDADGNRRSFRYSHRNHMHETGRVRFAAKLLRMDYDKPPDVVNAEALCTTSPKSTTIADSTNAMTEWANANAVSRRYYSTHKRRRLRLRMYSGRQRAYAKLVNELRSFWGDHAILFLGDWSDGNYLKGFMSTPGKHIRRLLSKHFKVYMVDEHNTSLIHHHTLQPTEGKLRLRIIGRDNQPRVLNAVLTRYNEHDTDLTRPGAIQRNLCCYNRDRNAAINILNLGKLGREDLPRPAEFLRARGA